MEVVDRQFVPDGNQTFCIPTVVREGRKRKHKNKKGKKNGERKKLDEFFFSYPII